MGLIRGEASYELANFILTIIFFMKRHLRAALIGIAFLIAVLSSSFIRENIFYSVIATLVLLELLYLRTSLKEEKCDRFLITFIFITFIAAKIFFPQVDPISLVVRTASLLAFFLLNLVLLIGPWSRFSERIRRLYFYRRHLGVTVFLLGSLHAAIIFSSYFSFSLRDTFSSPFTFYGFTAWFIFLWLAASSWDFLQKAVPSWGWKSLHAALFLLYMGAGYYFYTLQQADPAVNTHLGIILLFAGLWIVVAPYSLIRKIMQTYVFGWKQLHVLIYIAYLSILLHAWLGVISLQNVWLKGLFWLSPIIVFGSHLAGWIKRGQEDRTINQSIQATNQEFHDGGKRFIALALVKDFQEGKGKKFYVGKQPIAIFKQGNSFFAISNLCAHQKGPLYQGRFSEGVVECPWHYWTYNLKDGSFLGKEKFCLPVYETRVRDGILFVSEEPVNKEKVRHP